jgi:hypothetical protein
MCYLIRSPFNNIMREENGGAERFEE